MKRIVAEIRFGDGSVQRCTGRVVNGAGVDWKDKDDARRHIAKIAEKYNVELVRFV